MLKNKFVYISIGVLAFFALTINHSVAQVAAKSSAVAASDSARNLVYPFKDEGAFQYPGQLSTEPLYLKSPSNIDRKIEYDPLTKQYVIYEKVGGIYYRLPKSMNLEEYIQYDFDESIKQYWRTRKEVEEIATGENSGLIPQIKIESEAFNNIFGSDVIDIRPQGYVEVSFGLESNYNGNSSLPVRLRRTTNFDFDDQINLSVRGKIGDKVDMQVNYNTEATFDFENKVKLDYTGKEDEILRKIEAGNVSLPLNGTLIQGATNLFGVKTEMQFGKLNLTTIISQNKGESQTIETEGGAQKSNFEIRASDYDENRHFFLSKYFRDRYDQALSVLPTINAKVIINKVEVWVTNTSQNFNSSRDVVAFVDLGEQEKNISNTIPEFGPVRGLSYPENSIPFNGANKLYQEILSNYSGVRLSKNITKTMAPLTARGFEDGVYWQKVDQARKLEASEYTINEELGFISLNSALNNAEVLAVAFNFTVGDSTYQVGEFSSDITDSKQTLVLKMLKGYSMSPSLPTWDLMMKNVYSLGAYDLSSDDFDFNVVYKNDSTGTYVTTIPADGLNDKTLLRTMNLDNLNSQLDYAKNGDGMFDFIEGVTVISKSGKIIFPVLEPFGENIASHLNNDKDKKTYAFTSLYDTTKTYAENDDKEHNKFYLMGSYKGSSSSDISLNTYNLAPGSVSVYAGTTKLTENVDYTVDYAMGKVKIINQAYIDAGTPIKVSTESQDVISMKRKTMVGTYGSYALSDKFNIGGTLLYMNERPITNKVDFGEEPISNLMLGLDFQYQNKLPFLTDVLNFLPFYESKTPSSISVEGEVAKLITGNSKSTGNNVYIDDFEDVETSTSMLSAYGWQLASTPQGQPNLFRESSNPSDELAIGYNRANLAWYTIDRIFTEPGSRTPDYIKGDLAMRSNHYMREVLIQEIFPGKEIATGQSSYQTVLNLAFFPNERGPYNFDSRPSLYSSGIDERGKLKDPESRWGGIMRDIQTPNFETANVEYIEFWMMDPFIYNEKNTGDLYFNLGNVSEDILKDSRKSFENGLPTTGTVTDVDTTVWGRVSTDQMLKRAFTSSTADERGLQDVGLDGLNDEAEQSFYSSYLNNVKGIVNEKAFENISKDPSGDDFHYFRGDDYDAAKLNIIDRYRKYNGMESNSPVNESNSENSSTMDPDIEDLNGDNTMNELESYYQYRVSIDKNNFEVGKNHIVDKVTRKVKLVNGKEENVDWYQFKVPIRNYDEKIGTISDFKSIRFMRMYLRNFSDSIILRFGTLSFVRSEWRQENSKIVEPNTPIPASNADLEMSSINIEENQGRKPINYVLPPGIERETDPTSTSLTLMNEQSMLLKVKDLEPGLTKAVYKSIGFDMRQYKKLKMEVHAEAIEGYPLQDYELSLVFRLGSDLDNYYEYEVPLKLTPAPATTYDNDSKTDRYIVWPDENRLNLDLSIFPAVKENRDAKIRKVGSNVTQSSVYEEPHEDYEGGKNTIRVKGNPTLGEVEVIHIGIKNPRAKNSIPKSIEIWVNELRLTDVEDRGGWASSGRMSLRLADLGNVTLSGQTKSVGWGSISQTASERSLENTYQYDLAANVELGKLLPKEVGLHLPVYFNVAKTLANPEYNPLSSDVKLSDALSVLDSPEDKDYLKSISQDATSRKSFTLNNVSMEPIRKKADRKALPTDIENFSVSYSNSTQEAHNVDVEEQVRKVQKGSFDYNYAINSKPFEPLKSLKFLDKAGLKFIRDFNFSYLPELISFRTDFEKDYYQRKARNNTGTAVELPRTIQKDFLWNRNFDLRYNITRNLKFDFTNKNVNRIDQMEGLEDKDLDPALYKEIKRSLWDSIQSFGRPVNYEHSVDIQYTVPINRLPLLDFTSARVAYRGTYEWVAGSQLANEEIDLGNTIRNGSSINASANATLTTLYNKVPFFKKVNEKYQSSSRRYGSRSKATPAKNASKDTPEKAGKTKEVKYKEKGVSFKTDIPKSIFHKLGTEKVRVVVLSATGDTIKGEATVVNENRINFKSKKTIKDAEVTVIGVIDNSEPLSKKVLYRTTRFLLGVQSLRVSYTETGGTELPGFLGEPQVFRFGSQDFTNASNGKRSLAPGVPFLFGWQNDDFASIAAENGWITKDTTVSKQFLNQKTTTWSLGATIEPIPNLKIEVTGTRRESSNKSGYIQYNTSLGAFDQYSKKETGNFDMTIFTLRTAFREGLSRDTLNSSGLFNQFKENRQIIIDRLNAQRGFVDGQGYSKSPYSSDTMSYVSNKSSDVIIPALLATYTGIKPSKIPLSARPGIAWIRPNWRINYNGNPQSIDWMKDIFTSLNFTHSYRSTYSLGSYETNLAYRTDDSGFSWVKTTLNDESYFVPQLDITSVNIQEDLNPLINIDASFINDLSASFEINRTRNLNFSFTNMQLSEMIKNEFSVGLGYRFTGMDMIIKTKRKSETVSNDVNLRLDLTSSDYKTIFRKIDSDKGLLQSGTRIFSIDFQADYMISDKLTIKLYYNYKLQDPHSASGADGYLQKDTKFGLSFNYSIM